MMTAQLTTFFYYELNAVCLLILFWIFTSIIKSNDKTVTYYTLLKLVIFTFFIFITDMIGMSFKEREGKLFYYIPLFSNTIFFILTGIVSMYWFIFIEYYCAKDPKKPKIRLLIRLYCIIPILILTTCCIISLKTKWIFYMDPSDNTYHRGSLYIIEEAITYSYFIVAIIKIIYFLIKNQNYSRRYTMMAFLFFIFFPVISGIITLFITGLNVTWVAVTLALLFMYTNMKFSQISIDDLTKLNNRRQFDNYISSFISQKQHMSEIYLFMMDINYFKKINDTFGHTEGDIALKNTANILQLACHNQNVFLARYGGDEFVAVLQCKKKEEAETLRDKFNKSFIDYNNNSNKPYKISLSIGYAKYSSQNSRNISTFIKDADNALYQCKHKFHNQCK